MNLLRKSGFWIAIVILVVAVILMFVFVSLRNKDSDTLTPPNDPFSGLDTGDGRPASGEGYALRLRDNSVVYVPDFTKEEQPVWVSSAEYQVAGSPMENLLITYLSPDDTNSQGQFLITLLAEPLSSTRIAAEASLKSRLNLNDAELCGLNAIVSAGPGVNELYAPDQNLGFSTCSGATALP